jgi:hypothetical protein
MAHPAKKSQKRQALNREAYIESVERVLWRSGAPLAMRHMRHPRENGCRSRDRPRFAIEAKRLRSSQM